MGNFTNICCSLALHHQLHQCYLSLNSTTLPREDTEVGPGMWSHDHACLYVLDLMNNANHILFLVGSAVSCPASLLWGTPQSLSSTNLFWYIAILYEVLLPSTPPSRLITARQAVHNHQARTEKDRRHHNSSVVRSKATFPLM